MNAHEMKHQAIDKLDICIQTYHSLINDGVKTIGELTLYSETRLLELPRIGKKAVAEIKTALAKHGLFLLWQDHSESELIRKTLKLALSYAMATGHSQKCQERARASISKQCTCGFRNLVDILEVRAVREILALDDSVATTLNGYSK